MAEVRPGLDVADGIGMAVLTNSFTLRGADLVGMDLLTRIRDLR
jgi:hypothetical protein